MGKKKRTSQSKRTQITDSDGWTHISTSHKTAYTSNAFSSNVRLIPSEVPEGQTLLDLRESHTHYRSQWLSSPCYQSLQKLLHDELPTVLRAPKSIDRCVILGLGSLSNGRRSSWWELVFFETVVEALFQDPSQNPYAGKKGDAFDIYVQDPVFNHLDNTFLKSLGYTVLSDPEAFDFITPSTFLFAPHLETWVFAQALDKAKPRLCVGTVMEECLNRPYTQRHNHEHSTEAQTFTSYHEATTSQPLPSFDRDPWTHFTALYWTTQPSPSSS